jgi:hypothetical protein
MFTNGASSKWGPLDRSVLDEACRRSHTGYRFAKAGVVSGNALVPIVRPGRVDRALSV